MSIHIFRAPPPGVNNTDGWWAYQVIGPAGVVINGWHQGTRQQAEREASRVQQRLIKLHTDRAREIFTTREQRHKISRQARNGHAQPEVAL